MTIHRFIAGAIPASLCDSIPKETVTVTHSLRTRRLALALAAAPLVLGLSACKKDADTSALPAEVAPIAKIAPPPGKTWSDVIEPNADGGMVMGNPNAPIKLIEYGSLSCPHCAKFASESFQTLANDFVASGRVSFEFRSFQIHPQDIPLTMLVRCAPKDAFFPLVEQVYTNFDKMQEVFNDKAALDRANAAGQLPPAQRFYPLADALGYVQFFAQRGISTDQAKACLADTKAAQLVASQAEKYSAAGINHTPTLFINGREVSDKQSEWVDVAAQLKAAGAR